MKKRTRQEQELLSLMKGYLDHKAIVQKIADQNGHSPDSIDKAVRAVFGFHGVTKAIMRDLKKVSIPMLGVFGSTFRYRHNLLQRRKRNLKRINSRKCKKQYLKRKANGRHVKEE